MLTKKQKELLVFIHDRLSEEDIAPSFEEMKHALSLKSKSGIHRLINALVERGFIRRLPHKARAIEILKMPHEQEIERVKTVKTANDSKVLSFSAGRDVSEAKKQASKSHNVEYSHDLPELPLYGKIAAGTPIEALTNNTDYVSVPHNFVGRGDHYALTVEGDSMVEAGIHDGDTVIIERCDSAENGAIVVALVDDTEVTLKRLYRQGREIALEPANRAYETRILSAERVKVQGRLTGLMRRYH
ncbi:MAG: repressor LexA [Rickettsiales bacterium]|nr:repressor LexA [Rickettsiales bacterium]|tara:strand:+ start:3042 stop:3773 length:732 start_codon:yes stop_codon:yes gene_type:complete